MSRSKGVSFFEDDEIGEMVRSGLGDSGMMGGSMGDRSGFASSWNANKSAF
jgi:hypothetical protein